MHEKREPSGETINNTNRYTASHQLPGEGRHLSKCSTHLYRYPSTGGRGRRKCLAIARPVRSGTPKVPDSKRLTGFSISARPLSALVIRG